MFKSALSLSRAWVRSLVREIRSHKPHGVAKKNRLILKTSGLESAMSKSVAVNSVCKEDSALIVKGRRGAPLG